MRETTTENPDGPYGRDLEGMLKDQTGMVHGCDRGLLEIPKNYSDGVKSKIVELKVEEVNQGRGKVARDAEKRTHVWRMYWKKAKIQNSMARSGVEGE